MTKQEILDFLDLLHISDSNQEDKVELIKMIEQSSIEDLQYIEPFVLVWLKSMQESIDSANNAKNSLQKKFILKKEEVEEGNSKDFSKSLENSFNIL